MAQDREDLLGFESPVQHTNSAGAGFADMIERQKTLVYRYAPRDSHRGLLDIQRLRGKHHPET
jgi:hypothetical protein